MHFQLHLSPEAEQLEFEDGDGTGFPLDLDPFTGIFVERAAVVLGGRSTWTAPA